MGSGAEGTQQAAAAGAKVFVPGSQIGATASTNASGVEPSGVMEALSYIKTSFVKGFFCDGCNSYFIVIKGAFAKGSLCKLKAFSQVAPKVFLVFVPADFQEVAVAAGEGGLAACNLCSLDVMGYVGSTYGQSPGLYTYTMTSCDKYGGSLFNSGGELGVGWRTKLKENTFADLEFYSNFSKNQGIGEPGARIKATQTFDNCRIEGKMGVSMKNGKPEVGWGLNIKLW